MAPFFIDFVCTRSSHTQNHCGRCIYPEDAQSDLDYLQCCQLHEDKNPYKWYEAEVDRPEDINWLPAGGGKPFRPYGKSHVIVIRVRPFIGLQ